MRVLITGGAGHIGSHIAERLLQRGANLRHLKDNTAMRHAIIVQDKIFDEIVRRYYIFEDSEDDDKYGIFCKGENKDEYSLDNFMQNVSFKNMTG